MYMHSEYPHWPATLIHVYIICKTTYMHMAKARHLSGFTFCNFYRLGIPEQELNGISLGFGIVVEDKIFWTITYVYIHIQIHSFILHADPRMSRVATPTVFMHSYIYIVHFVYYIYYCTIKCTTVNTFLVCLSVDCCSLTWLRASIVQSNFLLSSRNCNSNQDFSRSSWDSRALSNGVWSVDTLPLCKRNK